MYGMPHAVNSHVVTLFLGDSVYLSDMSSDQRLLWCLIHRESESIPFEVTAPINASVNRLKELVREKCVNEHAVLAKNLVLYKVITL
jgi:hypothetical protein